MGKDLDGERGDGGSLFACVAAASLLEGFILNRRPIDDRDGNNGRVMFLFFLLSIKMVRREIIHGIVKGLHKVFVRSTL